MNRLMVSPVLRTMIRPNVVAVQQRFSSHGYVEDIGPPASLNQLPQPEGDWQENYNKKQTKYNSILAGAALVFAGTFAFMKQSGILFFNASAPETYE